ncbi:LAGLIDADG family homing endonuclease [Saliphagus infecundisoli]|uniref:DNA helicase n=1 Tax=Saliphagus infecundisoli TaxID=1849069 RepID=A0ABD5QHR5_9EURY|nr:LAGLIDADG family homing endonuclease [Saliphagus infecundisoli]
MAQAGNAELVDAFEQFFRNYYDNEVKQLAQRYPNEQRSLSVDWQDLYRFDPDLADDFISQPEQLQQYAEEALRLYDLPIDVSLGRAHVRVRGLADTESPEIREIRARHMNTLVQVRGIVRKATDVRPKVEEAAFECQLCGTLTRVPQSSGDFQEPHECQGCERQGPFRVNFDQSEFVDSQKLRIQESPEGLRGGETPQAIDVHVEDDITGEVTPGDHVSAAGVLRLEQQGDGQDKSPVFDFYMEGMSVEVDEEQFEDMDITDEDKKRIYQLSESEDVYERMVESIAPSIYGYEQEKLAMMLQLFSGVTKHLPDGSRIRGDLHMLLIGDPGTGKCVRGDTRVTLADGQDVRIRDLVESNLNDPKPVDDGWYDEVDIDVPSLQDDGTMGTRQATKVWKREAPERMYRIRTSSGRELEVTPSHPLFVQHEGQFSPIAADELTEGRFIATPRTLPTNGDDTLEIDFRRSRSRNAVRLDPPNEWTPALARLVGYIVAEGYVEKRDDNTGFVSITNNDREVLNDTADTLETLGLDTTEREPHEGNDARELLCSAGEFVSFLESIEPRILRPSSEQCVPDPVFGGSDSTRSEFLKAFIEGEGHVSVSQREITVTSMSRELLEGVRTLLLSLGVRSQLHERDNGSYRLRISGNEFGKYVAEIGFITERKQQAALEHAGTKANTDLDVVPNLASELRRIRESLSITQADCGLPKATYQNYERGSKNPSRENLRKVIRAFNDALGTEKHKPEKVVSTDGGTLDTSVSDLERFATGDVAWERIESIDEVEPDYDWVYDLEVEGTHNYVSNGVISHNSQMLSYIQNIAPRSVYTSGKGSSSAGLCVTADTTIHTDSGFRRIEDVVSGELPESVSAETAVEKEVGVRTFDRNAGEMIKADSSHVWRMPEKPCRRIETNDGKELEASVNTPVLTCGESGIEWTEITDVEPGDHVAIPKYDNVERAERSVRDFMELTTEKIELADDSVQFLRESLTDEFGTLRDAAAALDLSEDFIYLHLKNRYVPLEKVDRMLDAVGATREDVEFDRLMIRHGDSITLPERFDADLMYLLGLVFGDGDISIDRRGGNRGQVRISNGDEALLERAAKIFAEKFDKRPAIERQDDRVPCIRVNSATIARLFENAGMATPKDDLALAPELTTAEHADAFLRGLMDADGSVSARDDGGSSVLVSTISERLADQIQLVLETYGVRSRVRERDRRGTYELADGQTIESKHVQYFVEMFGADIDRYADAIGFDSHAKRRALEGVVREERRQRETMPVGPALVAADGGVAGDYHNNVRRGDNPSRSRARRMLEDLDLAPAEETVAHVIDADLRWDEVVSAVDTGEKEVFDLTVPETHNFVGNGIVTHNTAAAVRDDFGDGQQWTLEAGALVLADRGIAAIDELDKMRCVTGDTLVRTGNGIKPIRELAHDVVDSGSIEELENGRTIRNVDVDVWTMDEDGSIVKRDVLAVHEYGSPNELRRVELESGERLTTTADHPFFVLDGGERTERQAQNLEEDDWVFVPGRIPEEVTDGGVSVLPTGRPDQKIDHLSPSHGAILGYLAGDGNVFYDRKEGVYGIRFTNKEEELLRDFETACANAFDTRAVRHPSERRDDGVETVRVHGKEYVDELLDAGTNLENYDGKRLPETVTKASRETKAAFVRALADSEGTVGERAVKIASSSYELLLGTKMLLLEFGVSSQIQTRSRERGRDLFVLAITSDESLAAFERHIGFTLGRKRQALERACERTTGTRTIIDVLPECGELFEQTRGALRLHQSECGLEHDSTYCNFENGDANASIRLSKRVLEAFENRRMEANDHYDELTTETSWDRLAVLRERYHVPQQELAEEMSISQSQLSVRWGDGSQLRERVRNRLRELLETPASVDLDPLRELIRGDVKWRRVESVRRIDSREHIDTRVRVLEQRLADEVGVTTVGSVREEARSLLENDGAVETWDELRTRLEAYEISLKQVAEEMGVAGSTVSRLFAGETDVGNFDTVRSECRELLDTKRSRVSEILDEIERREQPRVYDLTVEGTHNFIANGMVVHNSEDRSAMHEALEQQQISVSKAGINATLKSRCSLLGAANPKYGRFDQYEPISEQIELEPALISRFDLIFTVTDKPDEEKDRNLAEHILTTNYAGELTTQREEMNTLEVSADEITEMTEQVDPTIDAELLRKYIAHAKQNCHPRMTEAAREEIRDFYVDLRSKGTDEDAPVPVTARKLEALVRLSEASARIRLSDTVELADAERVIEIVRSCLQDIGVDPETGEFDADIVEAGTSKSQRDRIKNIKQLITDIEEEYDEGAPVDIVLDRAEEIGLEESKAEHEIENLKQKGEVYEPSMDHLRTT